MLGLLAPYRLLIGAAAVAIAVGSAFLYGRSVGRDSEAVKWQARAIEQQQKLAHDREQLQAALDARTAELAKRQQEAADAVAEVRIEYLPAKTVIQREVSERVVFRDCRIGDSVRDTINAALRGAPTADTAGDSGSDGMPGGTTNNGG